MDFVRQTGTATVLVVLTLSIQCTGMAALIHWARVYLVRSMHRLGPLRSAMLMVRLTIVIIVLHLLQILLWAGFYRWSCIPSWQSSFYFSTASYSTVGSGDLLLPEMWRTLGAIESITGVLMCGLSVSFLFAIVVRLVGRESRFAPELAMPGEERRSTSTLE
jgi:voltage-gated potassium channel